VPENKQLENFHLYKTMRRGVLCWWPRQASALVGAACFQGTIANRGTIGNGNNQPVRYYDPRTWPASHTEADIKTLLQDKLKDPTKPPKFAMLATLLRSSDAGRFDDAMGLMRNVVAPHATPRSLLDLEEAVRSWLPVVKEGALFTPDPSDQAQLDAVMMSGAWRSARLLREQTRTR
jgi:hypothetical protein